MAAQEQIRKLLMNDFGFKLISTKATGFGKRLLLQAENGLEAQLGVYRICFHGAAAFKQVDENETDHNFPAARNPLCFDIDQKTAIKSYLEQKLGVKVKAKRKARVSRELAPTLFDATA